MLTLRMNFKFTPRIRLTLSLIFRSDEPVGDDPELERESFGLGSKNKWRMSGRSTSTSIPGGIYYLNIFVSLRLSLLISAPIKENEKGINHPRSGTTSTEIDRKSVV